MSTYDNLRRQCRTLESLLDAKLTSYARLAANAEREDLEASGASERWVDLEEEVDGLLEKVRTHVASEGANADHFNSSERRMIN